MLEATPGYWRPKPYFERVVLKLVPNEADRVLQRCLDDEIVEIKLLQEHLHDEVGQLIYDRTRRRPMILPVVVEV